MMMKVLDLFSGIGMYGLGAEQAGHEVIGFCENDAWARKILKKHWPTKPISWSIESLVKALTELRPASPARTSAVATETTAAVPDLPAHDQDYSGSYLTPLAWWDANSCCWRTWQRSFDQTGNLTWGQYLEPWPPSGVISNGIAWEREPLAHPTIAPEHTFLPTIPATEGKGSPRNRFRGSPTFHNTKVSEALRTCATDPEYLDASFAETMMGLPKDYTVLETETHHA